jgi:hypothetical protein
VSEAWHRRAGPHRTPKVLCEACSQSKLSARRPRQAWHLTTLALRLREARAVAMSPFDPDKDTRQAVRSPISCTGARPRPRAPAGGDNADSGSESGSRRVPANQRESARPRPLELAAHRRCTRLRSAVRSAAASPTTWPNGIVRAPRCARRLSTKLSTTVGRPADEWPRRRSGSVVHPQWSAGVAPCGSAG